MWMRADGQWSVLWRRRRGIENVFHIRDGMGVERLRKLADIETGIVTGESRLQWPGVRRSYRSLNYIWE